MRVTILEKPTPLTAKDFSFRLESQLKELKGELAASTKFEGFSRTGWATVQVTGEDSEIVTALISNRLSLAHTELREIEVPQVYDAQITGPHGGGLQFDIGLGAQSVAILPTTTLQAQLADGKALPLAQLIECYCLYPGEKISIRTTRKSNDEIEAWLSDRQMDILSRRITSGLDRIEIFDCYNDEAEAAVRMTHLSRDVIAVEQVTLTLQSIVCKLGTDAVGLIPKLGRVLRKQKLKPFLPGKIVDRCRPW
jgi:hypothetical protein